MNPTAWQKLRVFAPQILAFAACDGFSALAAWASGIHPVIVVQSVVAAIGLGSYALFGTIGTVVGIIDNDWSKYIPDAPRPCPNCASMAAEHAKLLADRNELREALAILEVK